MKGRPLNLALLNFVGGVCVLSSYIYGVAAPEAGALWGGVPPSLHGWYTASMLTAAVGYFPFTAFFLRSADLERGSFAGGFGYPAIAWLYALVLFPSSLWLPLTIGMLQSPSLTLWWAIRVDLFLVALGSLGLLIAAATYAPVSSRAMRLAAVVGLVFFCIQTVLLDALVWPAFFPF
jgi:hypothetical protein